MEGKEGRNYLLTLPMPAEDAYRAVCWAAKTCGELTGGNDELHIVNFSIDCGEFGKVSFSGKINPSDEEASLLKIAANSENNYAIVGAYEVFAKCLAETYDGVYGDAGAGFGEDVQSGNSYFDGGLLQLIGWHILGFLVTVCTLGICYPWACCMIYNWEIKHTVINGRRLRFTGTAMQLFGNWIKWLLLTIVTIGIYGLWVNIKLKKWKTKHTEVWN